MALSLDGFGAGITYGLRRTKIPFLSVVIISLCSGIVLCISMQAGTLLQRIFSPSAASVIGAVILMVMGGWSLIQQIAARSNREAGDEAVRRPIRTETRKEAATKMVSLAKKEIFTLEIRKLGLVIQILRSPTQADMDDSGSISSWEAMWLGAALSLDAFGAGLGAAMLGFSPWVTSAVAALFSGLFLLLGMKVGFRAAANNGMRFISYLPAFLLFFMGIMKLL
ncbi:sporulation membrane protein YtaF [Paenibacillus sp. DMB20]|uniref:sporulation membrane protein YtaF n=1 Tax=Paenibacillus sp. DMB20 TaxID=1642570 RepID=UPI00069C77A6